MKILYVAMKYDYGDPARGFSFEHENVHHALVQMGHEVTYFDYVTLLRERGRPAMNRDLIATADAVAPDFVFCLLHTDEFDFGTIRTLTDRGFVTFNWFTDDHWRFDDFSRHWAPAFRWVGTTDSSAVAKYQAIGYAGVLKTQWACNHFQYRRLDLPLCHDVTFVGLPHGHRPRLIQRLRAAGVEVLTRGAGWPEGRVSQEEMIALFNQSRINLNLSNSSRRPSFFRRWFGRGRSRTQQIKGRTFEVPGCGGFLLTDPADNLESYYVPGQEVAVYDGVPNLIERIRYYLAHEDERAAVAEAGWRRTLREHTYEARFNDLFRRMGLPVAAPAPVPTP
jgi:spore maturation protein CgeB